MCPRSCMFQNHPTLPLPFEQSGTHRRRWSPKSCSGCQPGRSLCVCRCCKLENCCRFNARIYRIVGPFPSRPIATWVTIGTMTLAAFYAADSSRKYGRKNQARGRGLQLDDVLPRPSRAAARISWGALKILAAHGKLWSRDRRRKNVTFRCIFLDGPLAQMVIHATKNAPI